MASYENPWIYNGNEFDENLARDYYGFVYRIVNTTTGRSYIGRKYFYFRKKRKLKESDWRAYYGSCDELLQDIEALGVHNFRREILSLHETRGLVNYHENVQLFSRDVLFSKDLQGNRLYYNSNIMSRYFCNSTATLTDKMRKKMKEAHEVQPKKPRKKRKKNVT